jgi:hypothetical protein
VNEAQEKLKHAEATHQERERELRTALEEAERSAKESINSLKTKLKSSRDMATQERNTRVKLEAMLLRSRKHNKKLLQMMMATKEKAKITKHRLAKLKRAHEQAQAELQQELKAGHEAWAKAAEADLALQAAKMELASIKDELEQEIENLQAQLEHQRENNNTILHQNDENSEKLLQLVKESQAELLAAETTINALKNERQPLREAKSALEEEIAQLKKDSLAREAELITELESSRQEKASLNQELAAANERIKESGSLENLRQALQQAKIETASLKQELAGSRETQREEQLQRGKRSDEEISKPRRNLLAAVAKAKITQKHLANKSMPLNPGTKPKKSPSKRLLRIGAPLRKKALLKQERNKLNKEHGKIRRPPPQPEQR